MSWCGLPRSTRMAVSISGKGTPSAASTLVSASTPLAVARWIVLTISFEPPKLAEYSAVAGLTPAPLLECRQETESG